MAFTAKDVKALREKTGVGMMECKKALTEADGDMDKAIDFLREKGLAAAAKKASRIAAEGVVLSYYDKAAKKAVIVEVNSETDFVAKNEKFTNFVEGVAKTILACAPADVEALADCKYDGTDKTVVMGRKTLESFPGGKPLKGRKNIVMTRSLDTDGSPETELFYVNGKEQLFELLPEDTSEVFAIGGESIYRLLLPYCDTFYVTKNTCTAEADTFYPDLDHEPGLSLVYESEEKEHNGVRYRFCTYKRIQAQA